MIEHSLQQHWHNIYNAKEETLLGWHQSKATPSFQLLNKCNINKTDLIIDIGSGSSVFIDNLLSLGFNNIIATDISEAALKKSQNRLGKNPASKVKWIVDDLTNPVRLNEIDKVHLWHDRAAFHFLSAEKDQQTYLNLLNSKVIKGGYAIIATFNLKAPDECSGLDIVKYDKNKLSDVLGVQFTLLDAFNYMHQTPSGQERPFIYTLFQKTE